MTEAIKVAETAGQWGWQTWFAAAIVGLIITIIAAARHLVKKQEEVWGAWMRSQSDKDGLWKEMLADARDTNKALVQVVEKNTLVIQENKDVLHKVAMKLGAWFLAGALLAGCAGLDPGADPVIVRAEQVRSVAFDTFNAFVTLESRHRDVLWSKSQKFKKSADRVRVLAPLWFRQYNSALSAYRSTKLPEALDREVDNLQKESLTASVLLTEATSP